MDQLHEMCIHVWIEAQELDKLIDSFMAIQVYIAWVIQFHVPITPLQFHQYSLRCNFFPTNRRFAGFSPRCSFSALTPFSA